MMKVSLTLLYRCTVLFMYWFILIIILHVHKMEVKWPA